MATETSLSQGFVSGVEGFLEVLQNRESPDAGRRRRERGFCALVRASQSLQPLQNACLSEESNDCLVARYRLQSAPLFGTLIRGFGEDLERIRSDPSLLEGGGTPAVPSSTSTGTVVFRPRGQWSTLIKEGFLQREFAEERSPTKEQTGMLDPVWVRRLVDGLGDERFLFTGERLVLLVEMVEPFGDRVEWEAAQQLLWPLPARVGIVISGVSEEIVIPAENHHFVDLFLSGEEASPEEETFQYTFSALRGDKPAAEDRLGLFEYAVGLARLILHADTAPLAIGIQGPWGKGKSSFMGFMDDALVRWAPANTAARRPRRRDRLAALLRPGGAAAGSPPRSSSPGLLPSLGEEFERLREEHESLQLLGITGTTSTEALTGTNGDGGPDRVRQAIERRAGVWDEMRRAARRNVVTAHFNAWQFEDATQIWAGLAERITEALESALPLWRRLWTPFAYAWNRRRLDVVLDLFVPALLVALAAFVLAFVGIDRIDAWVNNGKSKPLGDIPRIALPSFVAFALAVLVVAGRFRKIIQPVSERIRDYTRRPDYSSRMGYQHEVSRDLKFVAERLRRAHPRCRILVFIDDLDRCAEEKIVETLQAINLVLGTSDFFVVLGIDTKMIRRAVERHYSGNGNAKALPEGFADNYLRKIVQLSFHLPETGPDERVRFIGDLFSAQARESFLAKRQRPDHAAVVYDSVEGQWQLPFDKGNLRRPVVQRLNEVEDTAEELEAFAHLQGLIVDNPREMKRLINVHRLVKILLQRPEVALTVESQRKMIKWLIFCARWPNLIDDVLDYAKGHPNTDDCFSAGVKNLAVSDHKALKDLAARSHQPGDLLSSQDLQPGGLLARAALISQMVEYEPATDQAATTTTPRPA